MAADQVPPNNFPNTLDNCAIRQYARGMTTSPDPRVVAAAKALCPNPAHLADFFTSAEGAIKAADAVDPLRNPRTITTAGELLPLPEGSVVIDSYGDVHERIGRVWFQTRDPDHYEPEWLGFPVTVLWEPEA